MMSRDSGKSSFLPDFNEIDLSFSPFKITLVGGLSYIGLMYVLPGLTFSKNFIMNAYWFLSKAFSESIEMIM